MGFWTRSLRGQERGTKESIWRNLPDEIRAICTFCAGKDYGWDLERVQIPWGELDFWRRVWGTGKKSDVVFEMVISSLLLWRMFHLAATEFHCVFSRVRHMIMPLGEGWDEERIRDRGSLGRQKVALSIDCPKSRLLQRSLRGAHNWDIFSCIALLEKILWNSYWKFTYSSIFILFSLIFEDA